MSTATAQVMQICESLPAAKQVALAEFARFLLEREDDARWEAIESESKSRPKFEAFLRETAREGAESLVAERL